MRSIVAVLLALSVVAFARPAAAQDGEIRRITQTTATSDCIGDSTDPVCTLETLFACRARQVDAWCNLAGFQKGPYRAHTAEYRLVSLDRYSDRGYPLMPDSQLVTYSVSVELGVDVRRCSPGLDQCPNTEWRRLYYLIAQVDDTWDIFFVGPFPFDE